MGKILKNDNTHCRRCHIYITTAGGIELLRKDNNNNSLKAMSYLHYYSKWKAHCEKIILTVGDAISTLPLQVESILRKDNTHRRRCHIYITTACGKHIEKR